MYREARYSMQLDSYVIRSKIYLHHPDGCAAPQIVTICMANITWTTAGVSAPLFTHKPGFLKCMVLNCACCSRLWQREAPGIVRTPGVSQEQPLIGDPEQHTFRRPLLPSFGVRSPRRLLISTYDAVSGTRALAVSR